MRRSGHQLRLRDLCADGLLPSARGAQVKIEGILSGGGADEISRVVFDYVPGHSVRQGGLFFTRDPRTGHLSLRARGYPAP